ncbi:hypothetical protein FGADI_12246 [Fusarium gaditjirri]|uniref:Uncharacterized protein n=1 Tax=Fusarium gaditjirri TaxID=282569 RepID=A0A8H4WNZ3_9HYPO|nr:hypothetical protein FGADI_12246 [Fusarium gaditjirri]
MVRPGLYSCEPCLKYAIDWSPNKTEPTRIPKICIDEKDFNREEFYCNVCDHLEGDYGGCDGGTQRMGSLLERFIQHIKANRRLTKANRRLTKKASAADSMKNHRAEHKSAVATNMLSCLIGMSNSLRLIAECTLHNSGFVPGIPNALKMPARYGPEKMPEECVWDSPSDEDGVDDEMN